MSDPRAAALEWIRSAIADELPREDPDSVTRFAETIHAHALDYAVPVEECIRWIHSQEFRPVAPVWIRHCQWFAEFRRARCSRSDLLLPPDYPD
jgi:hypothetical protein